MGAWGELFKAAVVAGAKAKEQNQRPASSKGVRFTTTQAPRRTVGGTAAGSASCCTRSR